MGTSRGEALGHPVFVVRLDDESMLPRYRRGARLYVDPAQKPCVGDEVYIETGNPARAVIGVLQSQTADRLYIKPYAAPARRLPPATRLYRIVPYEELLGS